MITHYDYEELAAKAISATATKEDIENLAEWFERFGDMFWNGEYYEIDKHNSLYPVYEEVAEDEWEQTGWEVR